MLATKSLQMKFVIPAFLTKIVISHKIGVDGVSDNYFFFNVLKTKKAPIAKITEIIVVRTVRLVVI